MKFKPIELSSMEEAVLLTMLNKPRYGLKIVEMVSQASNGEKQINVGTLYPLLHKLEKQKLISSHEVAEAGRIRGGHLRKYYAITELGVQALDNAESIRLRLRCWNDGLQPII